MVIAALGALWGYVYHVRNADMVVRGVTLNLRAQGLLLILFSFLVLYVLTDVSQILMGAHRRRLRVRRARRPSRSRASPPTTAANAASPEDSRMRSREGGRSVGGAFGRLGDLVPTEWSQGLDKTLGKVGINL